ncbi:flagellin [Pseudobutyrivibrio sp. ACV-2]|uniref:flagellinolysin n=1 Tax=Pseudobutyrivibrio sp. ACV-2 TaxID=1520801 RepID=UPI000896065C|nr:flagellinolysin [Pseudobutyrivibrio sp. ACV-2]SEA22865.1 flagellin [Pseudobutyrivibrio sp. ACV-2]
MVVKHNLNASNSSRIYNLTSDSLGKSMEKLSSGYRINRAADDAAGLSISEKMRRQIRGLNQASMNGGDGISLVQIADGALNEVHDMLQRSNELAVQAANGTLSDSDRKNINAEITKLKEEINSITARTKFNDIQVFSKDGFVPNLKAIDATSTQETVVDNLASKISDEYFPNAVSQILSAFPSLGNKVNELASGDKTPYDTKLSIEYIDGISGTLAYMSASFRILGSKQEFASGTLGMTVDEADFPSLNLTEDQMQQLESTIAHETMHGIMDVTMPSGMYSRDGSASDMPKWFVEGTAQLAGGGYTTGWNYNLTILVKGLTGSEDTSQDSAIAAYLSQGGDYTVESRPYGHGYLAAAYASYLAADGNDVSVANLRKGADKIFGALINDQAGSFDSVVRGQTGIDVSAIVSAINSASKSRFSEKHDKLSAVEFVRQLSYYSLGGAGSLITDDLKIGGTAILGTTADKDSQPIRITNVEKTYSALTSTAASGGSGGSANVVLHLGTDADMTNKLEIRLYNMNCQALTIDTTEVLTEDTATSAIDEFGKAIRIVSGVRSYFGAMQNRLEHTIKNLDNVVENTDAAESRIRDADMADEMVNLSKDKILAQAGESMLAQANTSTEGVMALLQF